MFSAARVKAVFVLVFVMSTAAADAIAQPTSISWTDLEKTQYACRTGCIKTQWSECQSCYVDSDGYSWCDTYVCQVCVKTGTVCGYVRVALPDGDLIDVSIERGVVGADSIEFRVVAASTIGWWKQITIGSSSTADLWRVWTQDGQSWCNWPQASTANCNTIGEWSNVVLSGGGFIMFSKAKTFGIHTDVYILRNLAERLRPGDRVTFKWVKD